MSDRKHHGPPFDFPIEAVSQIELDEIATQLACKCPKCEGRYAMAALNPSCHDGAGVDVAYFKDGGMLEIRCNECHRPIIAIKVAKT